MLSMPVIRRATRLLTTAAALAAVAACNDSTGPDDDPAEDVAQIRLVITPTSGAATTYTIASNGSVTPAPLRVPAGQSTLVASFLRADGSTVSASALSDFRFELTAASGLTFTRTGPFAGTLNVTASNGTVIPVSRICLFHVGENHCDFGEWQNFTVTVGG